MTMKPKWLIEVTNGKGNENQCEEEQQVHSGKEPQQNMNLGDEGEIDHLTYYPHLRPIEMVQA